MGKLLYYEEQRLDLRVHADELEHVADMLKAVVIRRQDTDVQFTRFAVATVLAYLDSHQWDLQVAKDGQLLVRRVFKPLGYPIEILFDGPLRCLFALRDEQDIDIAMVDP